MKIKNIFRCCVVLLFIFSLGFSQTYYLEEEDTLLAIRGSLTKLQWAEREVKGISEIIAGNTYYHDKATEEIFKKKAPKAGIIHLATHAIINDKNPMYSKLVMSKDKNSGEDGFLNTYELYNMNLSADLVVLSACNTGCGKLIRGEGIMSLARGFMYAGCPSIVMSLWPVDDQSTSLLMKYFYNGLDDGLSKDKALRNAKLEYLKRADAVKSNPFYWAGFVPIGNTKPIQLRHKPSNLVWLSLSFFFGLCLTLVLKRKIDQKTLQ
jgi:CHAT domain-containing protein